MDFRPGGDLGRRGQHGDTPLRFPVDNFEFGGYFQL